MNPTTCFPLQSLESRTLLSTYYSVTDLSDIGFGNPIGIDINIHGQIVGSLTDESGATQAFIWSPSGGSDCGPASSLVTIDVPGSRDVSATAIDDNGDIVGTAGFADEKGITTYRAFLYSQGKLEFLSMEGLGNFALDINNNGQILTTGGIADSSGRPAVMLYNNSTTSYTHVTDDEVYGINDSGVIVGQLGPNGKHYINPDFSDRLVMGTALNDRGTVAWTHNLDQSLPMQTLYIRDGSQTRRLMLPDAQSSFGYDVKMNDQGTIIGNVFPTTSALSTCWILDGTILRDINSLIPQDSKLTVDATQSIHNNGQILATAQVDGQTHSILLTPTGAAFPTTLGATDIQLQELPPIQAAATTQTKSASKHGHARAKRHHHRPRSHSVLFAHQPRSLY